jgi:heavy metal efflux system protein
VAVDTRGGTPIRISDIGRVVIGNAVRLGRVGRTDTDVKGYPGGIKDEDDVAEGIVIMRRGENPVEVCERVKRMADEINAHYLPAGVRLVTYYDRTALVDRTLHTVRHNVIEGIGLVLLVLFFFLGLGNWRSALVVALAVPVALLGAFMLLDLRGIPANLISLGAIDFGIIVDSAVVVIENILRILEQRKGQVRSLRAVIIEAVSQMGRPILFSKAILLTAFMPLYTLQRVEGRIFRPMALTLTFALITGTVFAITASCPFWQASPSGERWPGRSRGSCAACCTSTGPPLNSRCGPGGSSSASPPRCSSSARSLPFHRQRIPAQAGRGRPLGAHLRPAVDLPSESAKITRTSGAAWPRSPR